MNIKTSQDLVDYVKRVLKDLKWDMILVKAVEHPDGEVYPSIEIDQYCLWLSEPEEGKKQNWVLESVSVSGGSYYNPPDVDVTDVYVGESLKKAVEMALNGIFNEYLNNILVGIAEEEEYKERQKFEGGDLN